MSNGLSRGLRILTRGLVWLGVLLLCLVVQTLLIEGGLRLMGYGESTRYLVRRDTDAGVYYTPNRAFYQQFSALPLDRIMTWDDLDFQVAETKPPDVFRVFVFGGSAIYGPKTSSRILEVMLRDGMPGKTWEVYNAACPGMNSHVMQGAATSLATLEPDLFLVYMGNNEAVGPFGPTTRIGQNKLLWRPSIIRALVAANDFRVVQLLRRTPMMTNLNLPDMDALMGMMPSMTQHTRALQYYEQNIHTILDAAERAGAQVMLCTLSGNKRFMGEVQSGEPDFNGLSINGILHQAAQTHAHAHLADIGEKISRHSQDGLPGYDYFYDNVHLNFSGNYLAAVAMFTTMTALLGSEYSDKQALSEERCAERLAWTPAAEYELLGWQLQVFQDDYTRAITRARHAELYALLGDDWKQHLVDDYYHAVSMTPDDLYLRHTLFQLLMESGRYEEAQKQSHLLSEEHPAARVSLRAHGLTARALGDNEEAMDAFYRCLRVYPDDPDALRQLAQLLFQAGEYAEARRFYKRYLALDPTDVFAQCSLGEIQVKLGHVNKAAGIYRHIIEAYPEHPLAYRLLDDLLMETHTPAQRATFWDNKIDTHEHAAEPRVRRALVYMNMEHYHEALLLLREAVAINPDDPVIYQHLGRAAFGEKAYAEAEEALRQAIRLHPEDGSSRVLLIETLLEAGHTDAATTEYQHARAQGLRLPLDLTRQLRAD